MPLWPAARRIIILLLVATLVPVQGLAWPGAPAWRPSAPADAIALGAFLKALNSTDQQVMTGPNRPQIYIVFKVDMGVPASNGPFITADDLAWLDQTIAELIKQLTPATTAVTTTESKENILDEIAGSDAQVRSMTSARQLAAMPETLEFERNPNATVPVERSMRIALDDALQAAGFDTANTAGGITGKPGTGVVQYEGHLADGDVVVTGTLVNGQMVLTKQFKPMTGGGDVGDPVTIRNANASTPTTNAAPANTVSAAPAPVIAAPAAAPVVAAPASTPRINVRTMVANGVADDSVYAAQPFRVEATVPANGAPPVLSATLTTHNGEQQTVVLVPSGTQNGVTTYTSPAISFHRDRLAQGTLQNLKVVNGQLVTVTVPGSGNVTDGQTTVAYYTDDVQLGIAKITATMNATSEELIRQRNFVDTQLTSPSVTADEKATLQSWRSDIDDKISWIRETRELMAGTDQPGLQLLYGVRRFDWLALNWDGFDNRQWSGNQFIREEFDLNKGDMWTDVMRQLTLGTYSQVARMSMIAQFHTVFTGYNEFNQKLTYEELLAENKGLAFDLAMFWIPGKFQQYLEQGGRFSGEFVISGGTPGGKILVPARPGSSGGTRTTTNAGGTTTMLDIDVPGSTPRTSRAAATPVSPATPDTPVTTPRTPTAVNEAPVVPKYYDPKRGKGAEVIRLTQAEIAANEAAATADLKSAFDTNLAYARNAGAPKPTIDEIVGRGYIDFDVVNDLYRAGIQAEGKIMIPLNEQTMLAGIDVRNGSGNLSDRDYTFLQTRLAQDPTYVDNLPNRGRIDEIGDGFVPSMTAERRDLLLKNPRVAQMVTDAKNTAGTAGTAILPRQATAPDNTGTVLPPRASTPNSDSTGTVITPRASNPNPNPNRTAIDVDVLTNELLQGFRQARQAGQSSQAAAYAGMTTLKQYNANVKEVQSALTQRLSPRAMSMSDLGNPQTAATRGNLNVALQATGISSGQAFNVTAINNGSMPIRLAGEGIVVEPVSGAPPIAPASTARAASAPQVISETVDAFCLERTRPVAPQGTQYRVAPPAMQAQHRGLVTVLHAAQRVMDAGGLHPDSDPKSYFNFIRQWSIWSKQENFNEEQFTKEFLNQTKKNVEGQKVKWTRQMEQTVIKAAPNRWRDVAYVLDQAGKLAPVN